MKIKLSGDTQFHIAAAAIVVLVILTVVGVMFT